jgi:hypothetical protein
MIGRPAAAPATLRNRRPVIVDDMLASGPSRNEREELIAAQGNNFKRHYPRRDQPLRGAETFLPQECRTEDWNRDDCSCSELGVLKKPHYRPKHSAHIAPILSSLSVSRSLVEATNATVVLSSILGFTRRQVAAFWRPVSSLRAVRLICLQRLARMNSPRG